MIRLSVLVVCYHSADALRATTPSWLESAAPIRDQVEFLVLDNCETDDHDHHCIDRAPFDEAGVPITIIRSPENVGFAGGMNRIAREARGEHLLLLNPDVVTTTDLLGEVLEFTRAHPSDSGAVPLLTNGHVTTGIAFTRALVFVDRGVNSGALIAPSGGAAVFPKALWERAGGMRPDLFAWGEDADLGFRLNRMGAACREVPVPPQVHFGGHSLADAEVARRKARLLARNRCRVWADLTSPLLRLLLAPAWVAFAAATCTLHLRRRTATATARGYWSGVAALVGTPRSNDALSVSEWIRGEPRAPTPEPDLEPRGTHEGHGSVRAPRHVVIVTYNSAETIHETLDAVRHETVTLVDNGSQDATVEIARGFPNVRVVTSGRNLGFAGGVNLGIAESARTGNEDVIVLNPDVLVSASVLDELQDVLVQDPSVGVVSPQLRYESGELQEVGRGFPTTAALVRRRLRPAPQERLTGVRAVDWVMGAVMVVRGRALQDISGMDAGFRLYCEDVDFCTRMWQAGWRVLVDGDRLVTHKYARSSRALWKVWRAPVRWHWTSMGRLAALYPRSFFLGRSPRDRVRT